MKRTKRLLKTVFIVAVFSLSILGVTYSNSTQKIAGEDLTVESLSLVAQATGECNTAPISTNFSCNFFGRCAYVGSFAGNCMP